MGKEIIKHRSKINQLKSPTIMKNYNKTKSWFFEKQDQYITNKTHKERNINKLN